MTTQRRREQDSDDALMRRAATQEDEAAAFARLVARHRPGICGLIDAVIHDREQAEDLAQETFCRVYRHRGDYRAQEQFTAYLRQIALNLARNFLRDRLSQQQRIEAIAREAPLRESPRQAQSDPAVILASRLLQEDVRAALEQLKPEWRETLLQHYFVGRSVAEIAVATGVPEGTVKSRLHHARRQLRFYLR